MKSAQEQRETVYPFVWQQGAVDVLKDASKMGLHEYDQGIDAYLTKSNARRLEGSIPPLEVGDVSQGGNRFILVARYPTITLVVGIQDAYGLRSWMEKYQPVLCILPEVLIPKKVEAPNNTYTTSRIR